MAVDITKDRIEGRANDMDGRIQEEFGALAGYKTRQAKGAINKSIGTRLLKLSDVAERAGKATKKPA
jgi:uncharacterized protein YjbJ (UPF0337 family)